eukprot:69032-Pleurochrysis_carterae.AAC.1
MQLLIRTAAWAIAAASQSHGHEPRRLPIERAFIDACEHFKQASKRKGEEETDRQGRREGGGVYVREKENEGGVCLSVRGCARALTLLSHACLFRPLQSGPEDKQQKLYRKATSKYVRKIFLTHSACRSFLYVVSDTSDAPTITACALAEASPE